MISLIEEICGLLENKLYPLVANKKEVDCVFDVDVFNEEHYIIKAIVRDKETNEILFGTFATSDDLQELKKNVLRDIKQAELNGKPDNYYDLQFATETFVGNMINKNIH